MLSRTLNCSLLFSLVAITITSGERRFGLQSSVCNLLSSKLVSIEPWNNFATIFEPLTKGRLTVWTGICNLPTSEFSCVHNENSTNQVILEFSNPAHRLGWSFHDLASGSTHYGTSSSMSDSLKYLLTINRKQSESYLECNTIEDIEQIYQDDPAISLHSACHGCDSSLISLINGRVRELLKSEISSRMADSLFWQLSQLVTNQHFSEPIVLSN